MNTIALSLSIFIINVNVEKSLFILLKNSSLTRVTRVKLYPGQGRVRVIKSVTRMFTGLAFFIRVESSISSKPDPT